MWFACHLKIELKLNLSSIHLLIFKTNETDFKQQQSHVVPLKVLSLEFCYNYEIFKIFFCGILCLNENFKVLKNKKALAYPFDSVF